MEASMGTETTIAADRFTAIAEFDVEPEQREALLETLTTEIERWVRDRPGFVAASLLECTDGIEIVAHTQWKSREDWEAFCRDPEQAVLNDKLRQLGIGETFDGRPYDVRQVIETVPARPWP